MANDEDGKVSIGTKINTDEVDSGLKKISNKLNAFAKKLKSNDFANLGMSITGIGTAFNGVNKVMKTVINTVHETTAAYKQQLKVETQLDTAIKNSPLLDSSSAKALKDYASSIQSISTYGDEELIPFMADLANAGRTEQQIMDIITAATDIAASGMMDLGSAVSNLNMTFQGTSGTLGRQISSIRNLSSEELKAGKAIEIVKNQFAGTAEEIAKQTGSAEQLKNSWGDLKEEIGAGWEKPLSKVRGFLQGIIDKATEARKAIRLVKEAEEADEAGTGNIQNYDVLIDSRQKELDKLRASLNDLKDKKRGIGITDEDIFTFSNKANAIQYYKDELTRTQERIGVLKTEIEDFEAKRKKLVIAEEEENRAAQEALETAEREKAEKEERNRIEEKYNAIISKRDNALSRMEQEAEIMGEKVDLQDKLNAEMAAYLDIANDPELIDYLDEQKGRVTAIAEEWKKARKEIEDTEAAEKQKEAIIGVFDSVATYAQQLTNTLNNLSDMVTKNAENNAAIQTAALEKQYADGKLNLEEYNKEKLKIEKESARKQYEMQMWEWSANLLQIGANTAAGIARAWAENPWYVAVPVTAMIGTSSSVQLAAAIANKPVPPRFAHGGIVPGNSYSGDRVVANVNSGEMILNAQQQAALWAAANGSLNRSSGGGTMNVSIKNYRGNDTTVSSQLTERGLELYIRKTVADSISKGKMNAELMRANNSFNGIRYES